MKITNLRTEYLIEPVGVDSRQPRFGWNAETKAKNWIQEAYRLRVGKSREALVRDETIFDTGRVMSKDMQHIPYCGEELVSDTDYYWTVYVWGNNGEEPKVSETAFFRTGLLEAADWQGKWIGETKDHCSHIFRRTMQLEKKVIRASLFVCGLGHFECEINGKKVSDHVLEPGWTNYDKTCLYASYDIADYLVTGNNAIGFILGDGMFNLPGGRYVYYERSYGKMKLLMQMNITYSDGTKESFITDENFHMAVSPLTFCCIYGGEDYDSRLLPAGYSKADFIEHEGFSPAVITEPPKGKLKAQMQPPVKVMQTYAPVKIMETGPDVYLYDFGVNFSGWVRIHIKSRGDQSGTKITLTPGEILDKNNVPDQKVTGRGYHWEYTMNETNEQEYAPRFTYTGFRYLQVEGALPLQFSLNNKSQPVLDSVQGEFIYPNLGAKGDFHCSEQLFNDIHKIILQAVLSNTKSYLTDCPHREKLPWLEQSYLIGPSMMANFDYQSLYEKIEQDMTDAQRETGLVPDISPEYIVFGYHKGFVDSPEWGSACIINPWLLYKKYGNTRLFAQYYDVMKKYLDYLSGMTHHHILHHGLGDWLDIGPCKPHSQNTPVPVIATAIYYYDLCIMEKVAGMLGKHEDAKGFAALKTEVFREYNLQFFDDQTFRYATGSQAAQAMSLMAGLVPEEYEEKVLNYLVRDIKGRGYAITAGDIGHPFVTAALMTYGRSDILYEMTKITDRPGYGYQVMHGATTLAEEWDGPDQENPHGSQNHLMLGSIDAWFYNGLAGIGTFWTESEFDEIIIRPYFAQDVSEAYAKIPHPYGEASIHWIKQEEMVLVEVQIPPNARARLICDHDKSMRTFGSGYHEFEYTVPV